MAQPVRLVMGSEKARQHIVDVIAALNLEKCPWQISISPYKRNRSLEQNNLLWLWYGVIAGETGHTSEEIHEYVKLKFLDPVLVDIGGEVREVRRSTTKMKVDEMTMLLNAVHVWAASELGISLPLPEERNA